MKYGVIEQMRQDYPVPPMCRVLGVSVSGYYAWRKRGPSERTQQEPRLEAEVLAAHQRTRESFGPERLKQHLDERGVRIGVHRIRRLRRKLGLRCKQERRFKATTNSKHDLPVAPNLLNQDFSVTAPNQAWCGDITYIATDEGWLYLVGLKDLYSGEIVGYAMSERMTKNLVMQALFRAVATRRPPAGLIHHSDRGSQGGFNWSSQHLQIGGVEWDDHWDGARNKREGPSCDHLADRVSINSIRSEHSGSALHKVWRPRPQRFYLNQIAA